MPRGTKSNIDLTEWGSRTAPINTWKVSIEDKMVDSDGKLYVVKFDKIFGIKELGIYNRFSIKKGSYENQLDIITRYTNFFMKFYDEDNELAMAYIRCKFAIDKEKLFDKDTMQGMIDFLYETMITPTMVEKIERMVEENYLDDIETVKDGKYVLKEKKYLESLEFTNEHIKILLCISFCMKIMSPVIFHYFAINVIKLDSDSLYIFKFYEKLFEVFGTRCNMYNKLFVYVSGLCVQSSVMNFRKISLTAGTQLVINDNY